jgi:hypothetical protein
MPGEIDRNLSGVVRTAASEWVKTKGPVIVPWRIDAHQLHKGLEDCGCGFAPEDDSQETR